MYRYQQSRQSFGAITPMDWLPHPGNEGGYIVVDPLNPKVSYAVGPVGGTIRVTYPSGTWVQVEPNMSPESDLRSASGQMAFSPTNPHELLMSFQYLMSSTDSGSQWKALGPDLTNRSGRQVRRKKNNAHNTPRSLPAQPSSVAPGLIWAGTSNGFIKVTRNHGDTWQDVSIRVLSNHRRGRVM